MTTTSDPTTTQLLDGTRAECQSAAEMGSSRGDRRSLGGRGGTWGWRVCGRHDTGQDVGPSGPRRGATGAQGPQGVKGDPVPRGPPVRLGLSRPPRFVSATSLKSAPDPAVGTVLMAKTSCPAGKVLLNGGAQVTAPGVQADRNVTLRSSFPINSTKWQTVAIVTGPLGAGVVMTMTPYVVCGEPTPTTSTTTTTSTTPPTT